MAKEGLSALAILGILFAGLAVVGLLAAAAWRISKISRAHRIYVSRVGSVGSVSTRTGSGRSSKGSVDASGAMDPSDIEQCNLADMSGSTWASDFKEMSGSSLWSASISGKDHTSPMMTVGSMSPQWLLNQQRMVGAQRQWQENLAAAAAKRKKGSKVSSVHPEPEAAAAQPVQAPLNGPGAEAAPGDEGRTFGRRSPSPQPREPSTEPRTGSRRGSRNSLRPGFQWGPRGMPPLHVGAARRHSEPWHMYGASPDRRQGQSTGAHRDGPVPAPSRPGASPRLAAPSPRRGRAASAASCPEPGPEAELRRKKLEVERRMRAMMDAPVADRKKALRELMLEYHPDKNSEADAKDMFQFINASKDWFLVDA